MKTLDDKLQEIEAQIESLSHQKEVIVNAINNEIAKNNVGDILNQVYKVPNGDGSVFTIHTDVKDICQSTEGQLHMYNCVEIRLDLSDTIHMRAYERGYVNADDFGKYNVLVHKKELLEIPKLWNVIRGIVIMNKTYELAQSGEYYQA